MELRVRTKCEVCGGSGVVYAPKCSVCDAHYDPADLENSAFWGKSRMPCGHLRSCLIEEWECYECQGTGEKEWWMGFDQMVLEILKRRENEWPDAFRMELSARQEETCYGVETRTSAGGSSDAEAAAGHTASGGVSTLWI